MNFSVVRGADTVWGRAFASELALQKRHLILLGKNIAVLELLANSLMKRSKIQVHCFETDDTDTQSIISVSEWINAHVEVDMLVNYAETGFDQKLEDYDIYQLEKKLKTNYAAGTLYTHQLLPNLLLHGQAYILDLWCSQFPVTTWEQALVVFNMRFSDYLNVEMEKSGLRVKSFPIRAAAGHHAGSALSEADLSERVTEILERLFYTGHEICIENEK